jgi:predicted RNA-binding Zn ribbon-like protein
MPWPPRFLFIANRLSVDFCLTGGTGERARWERWRTPGDLADWFEASSLGLRLARVDPDDLAAAARLREAVWEGAQAVLRGEPPPETALRGLQEAAARPDLVPVWSAGALAWSTDSSASQALSSVARDALHLFGTDARLRLRECRNPRCPLIFVDTSRPGRRAWCAMRRCGNLQKTARYRHKRRGRDAPAEPQA